MSRVHYPDGHPQNLDQSELENPLAYSITEVNALEDVKLYATEYSVM